MTNSRVKTNPKKAIQVMLDDDLSKNLKSQADSLGLSLSSHIRTILIKESQK